MAPSMPQFGLFAVPVYAIAYLLSGAATPLESMPPTIKALADFEAVVNSVTVQDVQLLIDLMSFEEESMTVCVGIAAPQPPAEMAANPKIAAGTSKNATASPSTAQPSSPSPQSAG
ncbi:hypothetical protein LTR94_035820, partial [Friedmanniomyces endolithicus]